MALSVPEAYGISASPFGPRCWRAHYPVEFGLSSPSIFRIRRSKHETEAAITRLAHAPLNDNSNCWDDTNARPRCCPSPGVVRSWLRVAVIALRKAAAEAARIAGYLKKGKRGTVSGLRVKSIITSNIAAVIVTGDISACSFRLAEQRTGDSRIPKHSVLGRALARE